jgi:hypothetical protein
MVAIKNYFKGFSIAKWIAFTGMMLLIAAALEAQITRLYWKYTPPEIIKLYSLKVCNPKTIYHPGDYFDYSLDFDKKIMMKGAVTRQLYSIDKGYLPPIVTEPALKSLGRQTATGNMYISKVADNDKYFMIWTACYPAGPEKIPLCYTITSDELIVKDDHDERSEVLIKGSRGEKGERGKQGPRGKNF